MSVRCRCPNRTAGGPGCGGTRAGEQPYLHIQGRAFRTLTAYFKAAGADVYGISFTDRPRRVTCLIDPDQVIRRVYVVDDGESHDAQVLAGLRALQAAR